MDAKTKSTGAIDWRQLLVRAEALDAPLTDRELSLWKDGTIDGNARVWNVEYVHAAQCAVEKHDPAQLFAMMAVEIPVPAFLLPIIAKVSAPEGRRPLALTAVEDHGIRRSFERLSGHTTAAKAKAWLAKLRGVSVRTIERSLHRTNPD